jgi:Protein of unknown function (DUF2934)
MARTKTPRNGNVKKGQLEAVLAPVASPILNQLPSFDLETEIRRRAYEIYQQRGCTPGHENDDWLVAEREVMARHHSAPNT